MQICPVQKARLLNLQEVPLKWSRSCACCNKSLQDAECPIRASFLEGTPGGPTFLLRTALLRHSNKAHGRLMSV